MYFVHGLHRCILSPVSSAVILPALLDFKQRGLGEDKGIITLVMAACSFDDIFCISAFGVCLSIIFSQGKTIKTNAQTFIINGMTNNRVSFVFIQAIGRRTPCKDLWK